MLEAASLQTGAIDEGLLHEHLGTDADIAPVLHGLWSAALLWRSNDGLHVTRMAAEALGPHVAGLGPAAADIRGTTPAALADPGRR